VLSIVLFYGTPILYPISFAIANTDQLFHQIIQLNPLSPIFEQAQLWIIDPTAPGAVEGTATLTLIASGLIYIGVCVLAVIVFRREAPRIAEEL
jgi:ABC-type polysaccharide/polyol phosphate export permease